MSETHQQRLFDEWLQRHRSLLAKVVRAYAFSRQDQEDLFQEVVTQVWNSIPHFRGACVETTWLYRVALNTALAWSRRERDRRVPTEPLNGHETIFTPKSDCSDPRLTWLYEQLAQLDHVDRSLSLLLLDGRSYREMAETLGISESNVGVKINRLKAHLARLSQKGTTS